MEFKPYKRDQLEAIIAQRLADAGVQEAFEAKAIRYAAGKVGAPLPLYSILTKRGTCRHLDPSSCPHALHVAHTRQTCCLTNE